MKKSMRAKRLAKHHKRIATSSKLNLVSLMDIFTILVFFLIVNQSEVRVLQNNKEINLPASVAQTLPKENLVISIFSGKVIVQEKLIWQQTASPDLTSALKSELQYQANRSKPLTETQTEKGRSVTIIGDASLPYSLLKQIMAVCAETGYRDMSLAVEQVVQNQQGAT
ncbi:ExbD/TolR family protein [Catenovulum sediminis]|uniref:ExbD/TolR family protein n=1 Tax=Catenovulum sediminis TaxID=1740262 RepID=UPI00117D6CC3|nr:biopolymer transporter ExbD [Catenovulum sediminis]